MESPAMGARTPSWSWWVLKRTYSFFSCASVPGILATMLTEGYWKLSTLSSAAELLAGLLHPAGGAGGQPHHGRRVHHFGAGRAGQAVAAALVNVAPVVVQGLRGRIRHKDHGHRAGLHQLAGLPGKLAKHVAPVADAVGGGARNLHGHGLAFHVNFGQAPRPSRCPRTPAAR